jgi:hypothetical protein
MSKSSMNFVICCMLVLAVLAVGCSEKKTTAPVTVSHALELVAIDSIIRSVAPPEYTAPVTSPGDMDSGWLYGEYPLIGKVFGSRDPQTLYANINDFSLSRNILINTARVDANNKIIVGVYVDSFPVDMGNGLVMQHFTATVTALSEPVTIPASAQYVMGTTVDVDYLVSVEVQEMPDAQIKIGMTLNDSVQTIFQWDSGTGDPTNDESRLRYGSMLLADSSFVFKGVGYVLHAGGENFNYAFNITSEANSDFSYRMSWFSNGTPGMEQLYSINGGGNKNTEFALRCRQYVPADTTVCDSSQTKEQVFGPNYAEGTGLITAYDDYLGEELVFLNSMLPSAMISDPFVTE